MKRRPIILISAVLFVFFGLFVGKTFVSAYAPREAAPDPLPRNQTLYIASIQSGAPSNFNPLSGNAAWPSGGNYLLTYETLFAYNQLTGALDPLLAESYEFAPDNHAVTITLQADTLWQDDYPLTTGDVVYSYELAQSQTDISYSNLYEYISEIKSTGDRTLRVTLNPGRINPGMVKNFFAQIKILPEHIWQARGDDLAEFVDTDPVGSGPYKLITYSSERIVLFRDDNYWGKAVFGLPAPKYVVHPLNINDVLLAFKNGELDLNQQFIPEIWKLWEDQKLPIGTWYDQPPYHLPGSIPILIINVHKPGLDNPLVRRALAYSINYPLIAQTAMAGYSDTVSSSLILPYGNEEPLFNAGAVAANGWTYDPAKAKDILENQLHATKGPDGVYVLPDATRLGPWSARTVTGWTDWQTAIDIVVQSANAAGFDLVEDYQAWSEVNSKIRKGDFDLNLWYINAVGPAAPWIRFRDMLDIRGVPAIGEDALWNFGRFADPAVPALLDTAGQAADPLSVKSVYDQLDGIFMENVPGIPLMYRPFEFFEFNGSHWTGFPTAADPSAPPMFSGAGIEVLYKISPSQRTVYLPMVKR